MREQKLQSLILAQLMQESFALRGVFVWRANRGAVKRGDSFVRFGARGQADILGVVLGRFLAIEVKSDEGKTSPDQVEFRRLVENAGGVYVVARQLSDALDAVEQLLRVGRGGPIS